MTSYDDAVAAIGFDSRWKLNDDLNDSIGSLNSDGGTAPSYVTSIIPSQAATENCGDFNGTSSKVNIPNSTYINSATTTRKSISLWFYADTIDTTHRILWGEGGATNGMSIHVYNGNLIFNVYESTTRDTISAAVSTGTLYHVLATMDCVAGTMDIYLNGSSAASKTGGLNISTSFAAHSAGAAIGGADSTLKDELNANMSGLFDGTIADVCYLGTASSVLSGTDASSLYDAGIDTGTGDPGGTGSMSGTKLTTLNDPSPASSFSTSSISPSAGALVVAVVLAQMPSGAEPPTPTVTGNGLTWTLIGTASYYDNAGQTSKLFVFRASGSSPSSGAVTADFGGSGLDGCTIIVGEWDGVDTTTTNGVVTGNVDVDTQTAADATTVSFSLSALQKSINGVIAAYAFNTTDYPSTAALTPPSGHTEMEDTDNLWDQIGLSWMTGGSTSGTATLTGDSNQKRGIVAFEVNVLASSTVVVPKGNLLHVGT